MVANMLESPLATSGSSQGQLGYVAFDLDPVRVAASRKAGFEVLFGDGTRAAVLKAAGVEKPKAVSHHVMSHHLHFAQCATVNV